MAHDHALLEALESFGSAPWSGHVWRHMFNAHKPNRVNVLGARWNPPGVGAIYTAIERETALAEGQYAVDIQPRPIRAERFLYELDIRVDDVVDLTQPGRLVQVGIGLKELQSDAVSACQAVGGAASWLGRGGLIVPSARRAGDNLVILVNSAHDFEMVELGKHEVRSS
jgi:RES domain-containing protein